MELDLVPYLESKGVFVKSATENNVHVACWYCDEDESKRGRLYISADPNSQPPWKFMCHRCGESGAINKIRKHFGDPPYSDEELSTLQGGVTFVLQDADEGISPRVLEANRVAAHYYYNNLSYNEAAFSYLKYDRGLLIETIEDHLLGYADGNLHAVLGDHGFTDAEIQATGLVRRDGKDFLNGHITIPYFENGECIYIRGRAMDPNAKAKYVTPPGVKTKPYNQDAVRDALSVVVTEGEFDALIMEQFGYDVIGLPGANVWNDRMTSLVSEAKRVYLLFDNDDSGRAGAQKAAHAIGPKARIVSMPEGDISDYIVAQGHSHNDIELLMVKSRGGILLSVDDAYEEWQEVQNAEGIKLGFDLIDQMIAPGILPGQVAIVLAKSGVGKTISMLNMFERMVNIQPDMKILFVSLEQTRGDWFERAHRIRRFYDLRATHQDTLDYFRPNITLIDKNQVTEDELLEAIEQFEIENGQKPDLICVDYLGYWARAYSGESYERTSKAVMAMKRIAKDLRIPFLTPHQLSRGTAYGEEPDIDNARDSGVIVETADFIFSLWSPDQKRGTSREDRQGKLNLKIGKSRHGGVGTTAHLQFAPYSLVMIPEFDSYHKFAQEEHHRFTMGDTYEQILADYERGIRTPQGLTLPD